MARIGRAFPARPHVGRVPPPAVNLLTCTDTLNDASWAQRSVTVAKDGTTGPTGVANEAWLLKETSATDFHNEGQSPLLVPQGINCTQSVYAKQGSGTRTLYFQINTYAGTTRTATFDVSAGSVLEATGGGTASIQDVGGGWWRCSMLFLSGTGGSTFQMFVELRVAGLGATNYAGDGTSGIYLARPQLEVGSLSGYVAVPCVSATGAVAFAGSGSLSAVGKELAKGSTSFAGVGSGSFTGKTLYKGVATFAGVGSLAAVGKELAKASVGFVGTASFAPIGKELDKGVSAFAGAGSFAAVGAELRKAVATFAGSGSFGAVGKDLAKGSTAFAGVGSISPVGSVAAQTSGAVAFAGSGSFAPVGKELVRGATSFAGAGSFSATGKETAKVAAAFAGVGAFTALGNLLKPSVGTFAGSGALSAVGAATDRGTAALAGAGSFSPAGKELVSGVVAFAGAGSMASVGHVLASGVLALSGRGTFAPAGGAPGLGTAAFLGHGSLSAVGKELTKTAATFAGSGAFTPQGVAQVTLSASVAFSGSGGLNATASAQGLEVPNFGTRPHRVGRVLSKPIYVIARTSQPAQVVRARATLNLVVLVKTRQPPQSIETELELSVDSEVKTGQVQVVKGFLWARLTTNVKSAQSGQRFIVAANATLTTKVNSGLFDTGPPPSYEAPEWEMPIVFRDIA